MYTYPKPIRILAQVLLISILVPIITLVLSFFSVHSANNFLNHLLEGLPLFDTWLSLLSDYKTFDLSNIINVYINSFFEATVLGICMSGFKKIANFLDKAGIVPAGQVLFTFVGLFVGYFIVTILDSQKGLSTIAVSLIIICGIIYTLKFVLPVPNLISLQDIINAILGGIVAVILTGYIATLHLFTAGSIKIGFVFLMGLISVVSLIISYCIDIFSE